MGWTHTLSYNTLGSLALLQHIFMCTHFKTHARLTQKERSTHL